jgi:hypothetical protein
MRPPDPPTLAPRAEIRRLVDGLRDRRGKSRADRELGGHVREVFEGPEAPFVTGLHFYIFEGAVSIYGAVANYADRDEVVAALAGVPGITQIADHLSVLD